MKKLLILLSIFTLLACSKDDTTTECTCKNAKVTKGAGYYIIHNLPIDCATGNVDSKNLPENTFYIGCED